MVTYSDLVRFLSWVGEDGIVLCRGGDRIDFSQIHEDPSDLVERYLNDARSY